MQAKIKYKFSSKIWQHNSSGGWVFVSLPKNLSIEIRENLKWQEEGWGRMKATAKVHGHEWDTAIWFDKKMDTYLLPLKASIRKKANLVLGETIHVDIRL